MSEETATYETTDAANRVESLSLLDRKTAALAYEFGAGIVNAAKDLAKAQDDALALAKSAQQAFPTLSQEWVIDQLFAETDQTAETNRIRMANLLADQLLAAIKDDRATSDD